MQTNQSVQILPNELAQIVESVVGTMMGLEVNESGTPWFSSSDRLTATVHLTGQWNGAIVLECNQLQARRFASRFLSIDPCDIADDVVRDVLGELANMIGGNLKCVLMRGMRLSMPSVVDGSDYYMPICGSEIRERLAFRCARNDFWVTVLNQRP